MTEPGAPEDQPQQPHHDEQRLDPLPPLRKLVELSLAHPDIGPPLAELAFAVGQKEIAEQLLRIGTDREQPRLEYFVVAAWASRRARRYPDAFKMTASAVRTYEAAPAGTYTLEDADRMLHLVRMALGMLMFELKDLTAEPEFTQSLATLMPRLEDRLGEVPLYRSLLAQCLWFADKDASEREWERARDLGDPETTWNARGTWYKEAERDLEKAERAYRRGLEKDGRSALLLHNLAQVLVERAEHAPSPGAARPLLHQADDLIRRALREDAPRLRRHIHATRDRMFDLRNKLPPPEREHREAREPREAPPPREPREAPPAREASAPPPPRDQPPREARSSRPQPRDERPRERRPEPPPGQKFLQKGTVSLGDMIKAKLKDKE